MDLFLNYNILVCHSTHTCKDFANQKLGDLNPSLPFNPHLNLLVKVDFRLNGLFRQHISLFESYVIECDLHLESTYDLHEKVDFRLFDRFEVNIFFFLVFFSTHRCKYFVN